MDQLLDMHPSLYPIFHSLSANFGNIIFAKRMELGYTQKVLTSLANMSVNDLAIAEGGSGELSMETYERLFKVLNLSAHDLGKAFIKLAGNEGHVLIEQKEITQSKKLLE